MSKTSPTETFSSKTLRRDQALDIYYYLRLNRSVEELLARLFRQNKVFGGVYGSLGQEAISVGAAYALGPNDWIAPMIRNIGGLLVRGFRPREILTQHMASATSPTLGKDGTSHMGDLYARHVIAPTSVLGDLISVMTGVAMGGRYLGQKIVALTWTGDGGTSTGAFHEGMNFAAVQKAPLVVIVENNQWAYSTPVSKQVPLRNLADRALAYGIPSMVVDGNDVVAVLQTVGQAVTMARDGQGPVLVEAKTMRMVGHAQHDSAAYVPPDLFAYWKTRDPISLFEKYLTSNGLWDAAAKAAIDARVEREIFEDLAFAESQPQPAPESAEEGVYCDGCHAIEAQWQRPIEEVTPPKSSVKAAWIVAMPEAEVEMVDPGIDATLARRPAKGSARRPAGKARK
jgi:TPP-dependent pyruvate/acetoin dehydrogenase alpha subunit